MGKKRKASGSDSKAQLPEESAKLALNSWEDIADEQDEFLLNREKILLDEGVVAKRRRRDREEGMTYLTFYKSKLI
jgi:U3 small nucleolar RNA-associated protein 3